MYGYAAVISGLKEDEWVVALHAFYAGHRPAPRLEGFAMITRIVAACARRPYVVLAAAALTAAAGYASQRGAGARRHSGSVESAAGAGGRMDGTSRARGRGAGDRGIDRRARGCARLDDGARLVDGGHGVRRRRVQVRGGVARGARRDRPPGRRAAAAAAGRRSTSRSAPRRRRPGWVLQYALRSAGEEAGDADGRGETSRAGRGAPPAARVPGQGAAPRAGRDSRGSPRWRTLGGEREEVVVQTTDAELRAAGAAFSDVAIALRARLQTVAPADRGARSRARPGARQADPRQRPARDGERRRRRRRVRGRSWSAS